jgi:two-component system, OmpR family, phosphate regulon response regulator PhoB
MAARVLLLISDRQLASTAGRYLAGQGYQTDIHADPQAAVLAADQTPPDIAVTDLTLAGRTGVEFLYELRSYPDWQKMPVIVYGRQRQSEVEDYLPALSQLGVSRYLSATSTPLPGLAEAIGGLLRPAVP